ncbi:MAG: hypothetical protein WBE75_07555 [Candidatus Omnitrophota bacterium]|jgi:hypothetical protein
MYKKIKIKNTEDTIEHYWEEQFESAQNPMAWLTLGCRLKRAADIMFRISCKALKKENKSMVESIEKGTFGVGEHKLTAREIKVRLDCGLNKVYFLLLGFAFENIFKGILISKNKNYIDISKGIDKNLKTHNLVQISEKCGINLNQEERLSLERLTKEIQWQGRYPVPLKLNKMISSEFGIGATNAVDAYFPNHKVMGKLFQKLIKNNYIKNI